MTLQNSSSQKAKGKKASASSPTTDNRQLTTFADPIAESIKRATEFRQKILAARDDVPYEHLRQQLDVADEALDKARFVGDLVVAAYFSAEKDRAREERLRELGLRLVKYLGPGGKMEDRQPLAEAVRQLRSGDRPVPPFHWEIEFPEVFSGDNSGFDAIVGNPPFLGGSRISSINGGTYLDWVLALHEESHGNGDLVAHFYRRAFNLLRAQGCFGLIATNTIWQGDTRATGLRWICSHGGTVYCARKRYRWPGQAAVVVSVVHVTRGSARGPFDLDSHLVPMITAYLFHAGGHDNPHPLTANAGKSFLGSKTTGLGFLFNDDDAKGSSTPIAEMHRLIAKNLRNAERIFLYIGGEELNEHPEQRHHRYVINFGEMTEEEARRWPDLMEIIERKVRPEREKQNREIRRRYWWRFGEPTPALFAALSKARRALALSRVGNAFAWCFLPASVVMSERLLVVVSESCSAFATVQSRIHEVWARFNGSTLKDDLMYAPSDCFTTFPFPTQFEQNVALEHVGREYYEFRAALMVRNNEGLTKTYNRFHDPNETSPDILKLRELHAAMDRAVLDAYGWTDLKATCEFLLDYEEEEEDENALTPGPSPGAGEGSRLPSPQPSPGGRGRKKPWRYRWPDDFRDEVLARLLELNKKRAEEERLTGQAAEAASKKAAARKPGKKRKGSDDDQPLLR